MTLRKGTETVTLEGTIERQTDKAVLFSFEDDNGVSRKEWFPLSQINEIHHDDPASIVVSKWIYSQKEMSWK